MKRVPPGERGAALLTVLMLVAVMGAVSAAALERLRLATAVAVNSVGIDQGRAFAVGLESLLTLTIDDLSARSPDRTTLAGGWNGATRRYPLPSGGFAEARVRDGGNCFNINSLAEEMGPGAAVTRPSAVSQFTSLMRVLEVPEGPARRIAESAADWADSDDQPNRLGAEDGAYLAGPARYRAANSRFAEVSELRAVAGMTSEIYARLRPWLCALPISDLSPINVNTLTPDQAPLLAMLAPEQLSVDEARRVIEARPAAGWASLTDFWLLPVMADLPVPLDVQLQPQVKTRWFALDLQVRVGEAELFESALVDARRSPSRIVSRRWGNDD